jgi:hypothetical protein
MALRALATYFDDPLFKTNVYNYASQSGLTFSNFNYQVLECLTKGAPSRLDVILALIEAVHELSEEEIESLRLRANSVYPLPAVALQALRTLLIAEARQKTNL